MAETPEPDPARSSRRTSAGGSRERVGNESPEGREQFSLKRRLPVALRTAETKLAAILHFWLALPCIAVVVWFTLVQEETKRYYSSCPQRVRCPDGTFGPGFGFEPPDYEMGFVVGLLVACALAFIGNRLIKQRVLVSSYNEEQERKAAATEALNESFWKPLPEVICTHCGLKGQVETYELPSDSTDGLTKAILSKFNPFDDPEQDAATEREKLRSQPNLRCKNCTVAWKDRSLSWKEPNPE